MTHLWVRQVAHNPRNKQEHREKGPGSAIHLPAASALLKASLSMDLPLLDVSYKCHQTVCGPL